MATAGPPRVAILHHRRSFSPFDLLQEIGTEAELVWVLDQALAGDLALRRLLQRSGPVVDIGGLSLDGAADALAPYRLDGIVSFVDDHLVTAAELAARLGLPYHTPAVAQVLVDKRLQRQVLRQAGVAGPDFWSLPAGATPAQAHALAAEVTYPAVVKPAEGSGSRGVVPAASPAELLDLLGGGDGGYVIEAYLSGPACLCDEWYADYFSVESVVSDGHASHVAFTGRFPLAEPFRETGNFLPGIVEPSLRQSSLALVDAAVAALGIHDAIIHTEVKLTDDGPKLIEVNGRLGGRPPFVLRSVSGTNLFAAACQVAAGRPWRSDGLAACSGVGYWLMWQPPLWARRVADVKGLAECAKLPGVAVVDLLHSAGTPVDWRAGTDGKVLTVRGTVPDHAALAERIAELRSLVTIGYD